MPSIPFPGALEELRARSLSIAAIYRGWAKRLPPSPIMQLAMSLAEQRLDLGKALGEVASECGLRGVQVEFELLPAEAPAASDEVAEPGALLKKMVAAEAADHELLAAAAGAVVGASTAAAERLAAEANAARKRSLWAQDQLELLDMLGPKP